MKSFYQVLFVDDDTFIRKVMHTVLGNYYHLTTCCNGIEAITWLEQGHEPHVIITDLTMPFFDGYDFIRHVRSSAFLQHIPVIVLSTSDDSPTRIRCLEMGADDFVVKPFNPLEVKAKIEAILRRTNVTGLAS